MKINFKQPKYVLPLILLPFLCLFFFVYHSSKAKTKDKPQKENGIQDNVGEVSAAIKKKELSDKLDAYRNTYKEADGYTALTPIAEENSSDKKFGNQYSSKEKQMLDSIDQAMKRKYHSGGDPSEMRSGSGNLPNAEPIAPRARFTAEDKALASALANLSGKPRGSGTGAEVRSTDRRTTVSSPKDPMELFKSQMAYADSMSKASDPAYKAEQSRKIALEKAESLRAAQPHLSVVKAEEVSTDFNSVFPQRETGYIQAIIDENITGYAGSRIRLRLLEDIKAGHTLVKKGTYLYALISGFSSQRVTLTIQSIFFSGQILPVKLEVYDQDGLPGLYVPESAFRDFTKDLSGNAMQGVQIQGNSTGDSQFLMSTVDKVFQSTSSAIAGAIRKNKARIKYNSYIYLIDQQALQNAQKNY